MSAEEKLVSYKPAVYYFRTAARQTNDVKKLRALVDLLTEEIEECRSFIRAQGLWPPVTHDPMEIAASLGICFDERQLTLSLLPPPAPAKPPDGPDS